MASQDFNDLLAFLAVARERSFTKAAAKLGIVQSTLSHTIKRLETQMGIRLLTRTTRSVGLTEAGERLRQSLAPRIEEIEHDIAALMSLRDTPSGSIRITLSDHALENVVWPKLSPVLKQYPDIKVEFSLDTEFRNIVEDGFDAGIRLGESVEKDMIAVRIAPHHQGVRDPREQRDGNEPRRVVGEVAVEKMVEGDLPWRAHHQGMAVGGRAKDLNGGLKRPEIAERLGQLSLEPMTGTPADAAKFFAEETGLWGQVIAEAKIRVE
jgi:DNA-binding transcriptional LysR family regulator